MKFMANRLMKSTSTHYIKIKARHSANQRQPLANIECLVKSKGEQQLPTLIGNKMLSKDQMDH